MPKAIEESFIDWEAYVFGFGYGTGEDHTLAALKTFMATVGRDDSEGAYDYRKLEEALSPTVAWLLINILCRHAVDIIEYGTSPRHGWLTPQGEALKVFLADRSVDQLVELCCASPGEHNYCYPDACNCGLHGYEKGRKCLNPFWVCK